MLECVLDYALYTSLRFLFEKSKKKFKIKTLLVMIRA